MNPFPFFGLIGNLCFGFACISLALKTIRDGHADSIMWSTTWLFVAANATFSAYLFGTYGFDVMFSIGVIETISWVIVLAHKIKSALGIPKFMFFD